MSKDSTFKHLKQKVLAFLDNRKLANSILDITVLLKKDTKTAQAALLALELLFEGLLKRGDMRVSKSLPNKERSPEEIYGCWVKEQYEETFKNMLLLLENNNSSVQLQSLASTVKVYLLNEGKHPLENSSSTEYYFPSKRMEAIFRKLLSSEKNNFHVISRFQEYVAFHDVIFFSWKSLVTILKYQQPPNETYLKNLIFLMNKIALPKESEVKEIKLLLQDSKDTNFSLNFTVLKKWVNKVWTFISKWKFWNYSQTTQRQLLILLLEKLFPYIDTPILLTDYLMDCLGIGGPVSVLALHGIFLLIQQHNLDYPNIYSKLYTLFQPEIFHTKYKSRLFYLTDIFLSSTHLQENLVAAYIKRLARLALMAPPQDIVLIIKFIGNLLIRHRGLTKLIDSNSTDEETDPFIMTENDPVKSQAINSSLWEIQTLQNHHIPSVAIAARFVNSALPEIEWDLSEYLDKSLDEMFEQALKKKVKNVELTYEKPRSLSLPSNEKLTKYWKLL